MHEIRLKEEFVPLAAAFKRSMNIVRQADKMNSAPDLREPAIQYELLKEPSERILFDLLDRVNTDVLKSMGANDYGKALREMVVLREPLDEFFNKVMVMTEDPAVRQNRLALMKRLVGLFTKVADFSKLQIA